MNLVKKHNTNLLTLEFKDKEKECAYKESFYHDYIKIARWVIFAILIFNLGFEYYLYNKQHTYYNWALHVSGWCTGILLFFGTFTQFFKKYITIILFLTNLFFGLLAIDQSLHFKNGLVIILEFIFCYTIFPRSYLKYSLIGNLYVMTTYAYFYNDSYPHNPDYPAEMVFLFSLSSFIIMAAYLKELSNRNDYLNSELIAEAENKSNKLLLNILPEKIASELKDKGAVTPLHYESVSIMFTDFKGFTHEAESMHPAELIKELDGYFFQFDEIVKRYNIEKLKTIGDSYMCVGGLPIINTTHAVDTCLAAMEINSLIKSIKEIKSSMQMPSWDLRIGIHTGSVVAGVIGKTKFAYDIWGDSVNIASRMESSGVPGRINISETTYEEVKNLFDCEYRGLIEAKNKGQVKMYFLNGIKPELSVNGEGRVPNDQFNLIYDAM